MLDLGALAPAGRRLYAQSLAGALAAGLSPVQAEAIAKDALEKAGLVRVAKSAEPTRIAKRIEPTTDAELGAAFLDLYEIAKAADPKARPGDLHSRLAREHPLAARAYANHVTG